MATPFAVNKSDEGAGSFRLKITGDLDVDTSEGLITVILNAVEQGTAAELIIDLRHVTFLGAAGVRALLQSRLTVADLGCALRVVNAHGLVREVLTISGVTALLGVTAEPPRSTAVAEGRPSASD